jgi:hypothetical protein
VYLKTETLLPSFNLRVPNIKIKIAKGLEEAGEKEKNEGKRKVKGEKRKEIKKWELGSWLTYSR